MDVLMAMSIVERDAVTSIDDWYTAQPRELH
jgi:hypothetical protein